MSILLAFLVLGSSNGCSNFCRFVWDNTTGNESSLYTTIPSGNKVTGIITIDGFIEQTPPAQIDEYDRIFFYSGMMNMPIVFTMIKKSGNLADILHIHASYAQQDTPNFEILSPFVNDTIAVQVSDETADTDHFYTVYTNTTGLKNKCNFGNPGDWTRIYETNNLKISDTDKITSGPFGPYTFTYLSVCNTSQPKICRETSTTTPAIGQDHNVTCIGSGAPYLTIEWHWDTSKTVTQHPTILNTSRADHVITSTITLQNFTLAQSGDYTCLVTNSNFKDSISYKYSVTYTQPIQANFTSAHIFNGGSITALQWNLTGWPLDNISVTCDDPSSDYDSRISDSTPSGMFTSTFNTTSDMVTCTVNDSSTVVSMTTVYRIGMNCSAGEFGVGFRCVVCPDGMTSPAGNDHCFAGTSNCGAGTYGTDDDCTACPEHMVSGNGAVKVQECRKVSGECPAGEFGVDRTCSECPWGRSSTNGTVKIQDCVPPALNCSMNLFYHNNCCVACPTGKISDMAGAAKEADCKDVSSSCQPNYYGRGTNCTVCPRGTLSPQWTVKKEDCVTPTSPSCDTGHFGEATPCDLCPDGTTSDVKLNVKREDCFTPNITCKSRDYYHAGVCSPCPANFTSPAGAAKFEECYEMGSNCSPGYYGYEEQCYQCPKGTWSKLHTTSLAGCTKHKLAPQVVFVIGVAVVMAFLGFIMLGTFIRFKLKQRRQRRTVRGIFRYSRGGTVMIKNHFAE